MTQTTVDRLFQPDEATATLPLVRRIVADIRRDDSSLEAVLPRLREARIRARGSTTNAPELDRLRLEVAEITTRFEGYLEELAQIGCVYRGSSGHIDFRSEEHGSPVFLCWSPEETSVHSSHPLGLDCRHRSPVADRAIEPLVGS
ncbi:MAG: DUF2203 domain-containing protein [Gemmatimonadota bacterium]|nr:DUF2203 domain-containing protein [Gemmatimonadota bacterium]MDH3427102.1 DUF2203 domain-containing protein [Gemmatimonadota bacterium]